MAVDDPSAVPARAAADEGEAVARGGRFSKGRLALLALLLAAGAVALTLLPVAQWLARVTAWAQSLGPWGPVALAAIYIPACVLSLPGSPLTLGAGLAFGLVRGTIAVSVGSVLGATAAFLVGRYLARSLIARRVANSAKFRAIDRAVGEQGFQIVLLTRLSPVIPFNLLNYALGLTRVKLCDYVVASWIGMLPATVVYVYLGSLGQLAAHDRPRSTAEYVLLAVGGLATLAVTVVITRLARRALAEAIGRSSSASGAALPGQPPR